MMEVVPLTSVSVSHLAPTLEEEVQCWLQELFWDFRPAARLIREYVAAHSLPGFALRNRSGHVTGYSYYVIDRPVAYIGNLFVCRHCPSLEEGYGNLVEKTVEAIHGRGRIERIESQVVDFNIQLLPFFSRLGFQARKRFFLLLPLDQVEIALPPPPPGFRFQPWQRRYCPEAAQVIYDSYQGSPDFDLCRDYQSAQGCLRFLRNLVDNPGCGVFCPDTSLLAFNEKEELCAVLLTSEISAGTGMIPQISVRRDCQGKGLGRFLLNSYFEAARKKRLQRVTLSVSAANQLAYRLYRRLGFRPFRQFHAFLWEKGA